MKYQMFFMLKYAALAAQGIHHVCSSKLRLKIEFPHAAGKVRQTVLRACSPRSTRARGVCVD